MICGAGGGLAVKYVNPANTADATAATLAQIAAQKFHFATRRFSSCLFCAIRSALRAANLARREVLPPRP